MTLRLAVALLFWLAGGLIQKFIWGMGDAKALVMLAVLAATPFVVAVVERTQRARSSSPHLTPRCAGPPSPPLRGGEGWGGGGGSPLR